MAVRTGPPEAGPRRGHSGVELMGEAIENCDYQQLLDQSKLAFDQLISD